MLSWVTELAHNQFVGGVLVASALAITAKSGAKASSFVYNNLITTIAVDSNESNYASVERWSSELKYTKKAKNVRLVPDKDDTEGLKMIKVLGYGDHYFRHTLGFIKLHKQVENTQNNKRETIFITLLWGRHKVEKLISEIQETVHDKNALSVWRYVWEWRKVAQTRARSFSSITLAEGVVSSLIIDVQSFMNNTAEYRTLGVCHKRGYLIHGLPGCGKTSLIKAMASYLGFPVYLIDLTTVTSDNAFIDAMATAPKKCLLVLEEVDVLPAMRERVKETAGIPVLERLSLGTVLNVLDGLLSTEGRIVVMTTNHIDRLDPALIRAGRVDYRVCLERFNESLAREMCQSFKDVDTILEGAEYPIAPSEVQERIIRNTNSLKAVKNK